MAAPKKRSSRKSRKSKRSRKSRSGSAVRAPHPDDARAELEARRTWEEGQKAQEEEAQRRGIYLSRLTWEEEKKFRDSQHQRQSQYQRGLHKEPLDGVIRRRPGWEIRASRRSLISGFRGKYELIHTKDGKQIAFDLTSDEAHGILVAIETLLPGVGERTMSPHDAGTIYKLFESWEGKDFLRYSGIY